MPYHFAPCCACSSQQYSYGSPSEARSLCLPLKVQACPGCPYQTARATGLLCMCCWTNLWCHVGIWGWLYKKGMVESLVGSHWSHGWCLWYAYSSSKSRETQQQTCCTALEAPNPKRQTQHFVCPQAGRERYIYFPLQVPSAPTGKIPIWQHRFVQCSRQEGKQCVQGELVALAVWKGQASPWGALGGRHRGPSDWASDRQS